MTGKVAQGWKALVALSENQGSPHSHGGSSPSLGPIPKLPIPNSDFSGHRTHCTNINSGKQLPHILNKYMYVCMHIHMYECICIYTYKCLRLEILKYFSIQSWTLSNLFWSNPFPQKGISLFPSDYVSLSDQRNFQICNSVAVVKSPVCLQWRHFCHGCGSAHMLNY